MQTAPKARALVPVRGGLDEALQLPEPRVRAAPGGAVAHPCGRWWSLSRYIPSCRWSAAPAPPGTGWCSSQLVSEQCLQHSTPWGQGWHQAIHIPTLPSFPCQPEQLAAPEGLTIRAQQTPAHLPNQWLWQVLPDSSRVQTAGEGAQGKEKLQMQFAINTWKKHCPSFSSLGPQALLTKLQLLLHLEAANSSSINLSNDLSISQKHFASTKCLETFLLHTSSASFITCHIRGRINKSFPFTFSSLKISTAHDIKLGDNI